MPGLSGLELATETKANCGHTVTVLMSGWSTDGTRVSQSPDIDFYLRKPIEEEDLKEILDRTLERVAST